MTAAPFQGRILLAVFLALMMSSATMAFVPSPSSFHSTRRTTNNNNNLSDLRPSSTTTTTTTSLQVGTSPVTTAGLLTQAIVSAGAVVGAAKASQQILQADGSIETLAALDDYFPGSLTNQQVAQRVFHQLAKYGYGKTSLFGSSLCSDEVCRPLENAFGTVYSGNYQVGGLAGFPFGGVTAVKELLSHCPDGGSSLLVYGPHVGIDSQGGIGQTERRGQTTPQPCCASSLKAMDYVAQVRSGTVSSAASSMLMATDLQQSYVGQLLLPYADRLHFAHHPMVELPYAMFDAQTDLMKTVVKDALQESSDKFTGNLAVLGGIQINTPYGQTDYFLPLSFDLYNAAGEKVETLSL